MNPTEEKLYEAIALEIAEKRLKPSTYTKAFADSGGDKDRALATYIQMRFEEMRLEFLAKAAAPRS